MYSVVLEIPPIPKGRPRFSRFGHAYTPKTTRQYESEIVQMLKVAKPPKFVGAVSVMLIFYLKQPKARSKESYPIGNKDVDNFAKAVMDASNGILWDDDAQVVDLFASKRWADESPKIEIHVCSTGKEPFTI